MSMSLKAQSSIIDSFVLEARWKSGQARSDDTPRRPLRPKTTKSDKSNLLPSSSIYAGRIENPQHEFEVVDQNEFLDNVLIDNCSDAESIVHFCDESSSLSIDVELHLVEILRNDPEGRFCLYHIDSQMAPYFTSKLSINTDESTLLRFKNGKLIGRISFLTSEHCYCNLEQWVADTEQEDDVINSSSSHV
ncbi:MAG: hypothetical protein SGBAC_010808 [Bacillariaceae sp.]